MNLTNVVYFILFSNLILVSSNNLFDFSSFSGRNMFYSRNLYSEKDIKNKNETEELLNHTNFHSNQMKKNQKNKDVVEIDRIPTIALVSYFSEKLNKTIIDSDIVYWLKSGGARLVIIDQNFPQEKLAKIFSYVNSFLIQDYSTIVEKIDLKNSYQKFVTKLIENLLSVNYQSKKQSTHRRQYLPLFGIGTGANLIQAAVANRSDIIKSYKKVKLTNKKIELIGPVKKIRWISNFDKRDYSNLLNKSNSFFTNDDFVDYKYYLKNVNLRRYLKITGLAKDELGENFVSIFEGNRLPFYGIAFNPEKIIWKNYEEEDLTKNKNAKRGSPYSTNNAITISQKFLNFIINSSRKNSNDFKILTNGIKIMNKTKTGHFNSTDESLLKNLVEFNFKEYLPFNKNHMEKIIKNDLRYNKTEKISKNENRSKQNSIKKKYLKKIFAKNDEFFFIDSPNNNIKNKEKSMKNHQKKHHQKHDNSTKHTVKKDKRISSEDLVKSESFNKKRIILFARFKDEKRIRNIKEKEIPFINSEDLDLKAQKKGISKKYRKGFFLTNLKEKLTENSNFDKFINVEVPFITEFLSVQKDKSNPSNSINSKKLKINIRNPI